MIQKIDHKEVTIAKKIYELFQASYSIEAELLEVNDFPPLQRTIEHFVSSLTEFYAFYKNEKMAGLIEVSGDDTYTDIESLVVDPGYFRQGIGGQLLSYIVSLKDSKIFLVETGLKNKPAILLYEKVGFQEIKQWDTPFGVRKIRLEKRCDI